MIIITISVTIQIINIFNGNISNKNGMDKDDINIDDEKNMKILIEYFDNSIGVFLKIKYKRTDNAANNK